MRIVRQSVGILLLMTLLGYPAMACLIPAMEMTEAERDCCEQMAQQCGSMGMPSSHSCCQKEIGRANSMLCTPLVQLVPPAVNGAIESELSQLRVTENRVSFFELHPSPESPPGASSILRI